MTLTRRPLGGTSGGAPRWKAAATPKSPGVPVSSGNGRHRRVGKYVLWGILGLLGLIAAAVGVVLSPLLAIKEAEVHGVQGEHASELVDSLGLIDQPLLLSDLATIAEDARDIPWVANVVAEKDWPNTVRLTVTPQRPAMLVDTGSHTHVMTASGSVIPPEAAGPLDGFLLALPTVDISGTEFAGEVRESGSAPGPAIEVLSVFRLMGPSSTERLRTASVADDGIVSFEMDQASPNGPAPATIVFGLPTDVPEKVIAVEAALGGSVDLTCLERLDVSVPSRIVITRAQGCEIGIDPSEDR